MDNVILAKVIQRYEYLNSKPFDQIQGESLEMVHLYELVQVYTQHFKNDHQMLSEIELINSSDDILFVVEIFIIQMLNQFSLDQSLFV